MRLALLTIAMVLALGATARAQPIVIEAHVGEPPAEGARILSVVFEELAHRDYRVGVEGVGAALEAKVSRPASTGYVDAKEILATLSAGIDLWTHSKGAEDFQKAADSLEKTLTTLRANQALLASDQSITKQLFAADLALALSKSRLGDQIGARAAMSNLIISHPDTAITRSDHGPDADRLYKHARAAFDSSGPGTLNVTVDDPVVNIYLNEEFVGSGSLTRSVLPGEHRIYVQRGKVPGRLHVVQVAPGVETKLEIDWLLDATLESGAPFVGLRFDSEEQRTEHAARLATKIAGELGAAEVIVLGFGDLDGVQAVIGTLYSVETGTPVRRLGEATVPDPPARRLKAFAAYLGGDPPDPSLTLLVPIPIEYQRMRDESGGSSHGWVKWTTGAAAVGGIVAGLYLIDLHGKGTCNAVNAQCQEEWYSAPFGYASLGVSAVLAGVTTYLFVRDPWKRDEPRTGDTAPTVSLTSWPGTIGISVLGVF